METIINQAAKQNSLLYRSWILIIVMSFLFSLYYFLVVNLYILITLIIITLPTTLISATSENHLNYFKTIIFNTIITFVICLYPLFNFSQFATFIFLLYCFFDWHLIAKKWNKILEQPLHPIEELNQNITNRDQFTLNYEIKHGRVWQLKYHSVLLILIIIFTIPLAFLARSANNFFIYIPISLFFSFLFWEYTLKRFLFFYIFFKIMDKNKAH